MLSAGSKTGHRQSLLLHYYVTVDSLGPLHSLPSTTLTPSAPPLALQVTCSTTSCKAPCGTCDPGTDTCQLQAGGSCTTDKGEDGTCAAGACKVGHLRLKLKLSTMAWLALQARAGKIAEVILSLKPADALITNHTLLYFAAVLYYERPLLL